MTDRPRRFGLSKSKITMFEQCPKRLWLSVHRRDLPEQDDGAEARFATGHEVGAIACALLPDGVMVDAEPDLSAALATTRALLDDGHDRPIFEATLQHDGVLVRIDVLEPDGSGGWHMADVKSSTKAKDYHVGDLATPLWVARNAGVPIGSAAIRHIDSSFVLERDGDFDGLFADIDLDASSLLDEVLGAGVQSGDAEESPVEASNGSVTEQVTIPSPRPEAASASRPTLSVRPVERPEAAVPDWPTRMVFQPKIRRDLGIFEKPVAGQSLTNLAIRDPYGCADGRNRQCLIDFMVMLVRASQQIGAITVVSFDADSVDRYAAESSVQQYDDLQARWKQASPGRPALRYIQLSRRQSRGFHDRSIKARMAAGREVSGTYRTASTESCCQTRNARCM